MSNVDPQLAAAVAGGGKSGPSKNTTPSHDDIPERLARVRTAFPTLPVDELPPATSLIVKIWRQLCARAQRPSSSPHMPFGTGADSSVDAGFAAELKRGRTDEPPKYALPKPNAAPDEAEDLTADARAVPITACTLFRSVGLPDNPGSWEFRHANPATPVEQLLTSDGISRSLPKTSMRLRASHFQLQKQPIRHETSIGQSCCLNEFSGIPPDHRMFADSLCAC
jgi:hypothetical protein